jgi:hypothetical protein
MTSFDYRRELTREDWMKLAGAAAGAAAGVAGVVLYFGRLWLQRVPLPRGTELVAGSGSYAVRLRRPRGSAAGHAR